MNTTEPQKGFFVSDLHLFTRRSVGDDLLPELQRVVRNAHTLVLGGDIFDFKWSTHPSFDHSLDMAIQWIQALQAQNANCDFHFVLGNHDCHPRFVERLEQYAQQQPRFRWHPYFVRLEQCLFLHGDIVAKGAHDHDVLDIHREKHHHKKNKREVSHFAYDVAVRARLHRVAMLGIREMKVLQRVRDYADKIDQGPDQGVSDVYFGHTHVEIDGVKYRGLCFHNGGGAIRGLKFRIIETSLQPR